MRGLALRAATHLPRVALLSMGCFESVVVHLVYCVGVDFGSQLVLGATICEFGLLGVSSIEGEKKL